MAEKKSAKGAGKIKVSENYMDCVPVRAEDKPWRTLDDGSVEVDMENRGFYNFIAQKFFKKPRISHISLDKYGSVVWKGIDGKNTVGDIVLAMEAAFPNEKDRMLDRVVTYMATLQRSGFITMSKR